MFEICGIFISAKKSAKTLFSRNMAYFILDLNFIWEKIEFYSLAGIMNDIRFCGIFTYRMYESFWNDILLQTECVHSQNNLIQNCRWFKIAAVYNKRTIPKIRSFMHFEQADCWQYSTSFIINALLHYWIEMFDKKISAKLFDSWAATCWHWQNPIQNKVNRNK